MEKSVSICLRLLLSGRSNETKNGFDSQQATPCEVKDFMDLSIIDSSLGTTSQKQMDDPAAEAQISE